MTTGKDWHSATVGNSPYHLVADPPLGALSKAIQALPDQLTHARTVFGTLTPLRSGTAAFTHIRRKHMCVKCSADPRGTATYVCLTVYTLRRPGGRLRGLSSGVARRWDSEWRNNSLTLAPAVLAKFRPTTTSALLKGRRGDATY